MQFVQVGVKCVSGVWKLVQFPLEMDTFISGMSMEANR